MVVCSLRADFAVSGASVKIYACGAHARMNVWVVAELEDMGEMFVVEVEAEWLTTRWRGRLLDLGLSASGRGEMDG